MDLKLNHNKAYLTSYHVYTYSHHNKEVSGKY